MYSVILLSGGKGKRMMKNIPKQYLLLAGKPVIMHSLERFDRNKNVSEIIIVCEQEYRSSLELMLQQYNIETTIMFADAGDTRQQSVYNGLLFASNENVIIHEAARPFVTSEDIQRLIDEVEPNAMMGYPIPFTVLKGREYVSDILDRSELINVQLPQKYERRVILEAHEKAIEEGRKFTEDASMVFAYTSKPVKVIKGSSYNLKITESVDLAISEVIYKEYIVGRK